VIGRHARADDPALAHTDGRVAQSQMLDAAIGTWTLQHTAQEALSVLEAADIPAGRIYSVADIVADPHYRAREMLLDAVLPGGTAVKMPGIVPKLSDTPGVIRWQGPSLGQHTDSVLMDLGFDADGIGRLRSSGAVQ
jgi:crotonobetainyl-CoA:carnitine CoA-transferase CaiB-like acyl-CoA transferase